MSITPISQHDLHVSQTNLSHAKSEGSFSEIVEAKKRKIIERHHLPHATVEHQLQLLDELSKFELGRFLLEHAGLNGFWTNYLVQHPSTGRLSGINPEGKFFSALENFMLDRAPTALATQQRFRIFQEEIQKQIKDGISFASVPCGLMHDLLDQDYSKDFYLTGIDIDSESLDHAENLAKEKKISKHCTFIKRDAWELNIENEFDLITSNGLNIYEPDDEKVEGLYRQFFNALKPHGRLITSFLTPPPGSSAPTEWDLKKVHLQDAQFQKLLFVDIIESKWQCYRTAELTIQQLKKVGFESVDIIFDNAHIFPTVIAIKPDS